MSKKYNKKSFYEDPKFKSYWNEIISTLGDDFVSFFKDTISDKSEYFTSFSELEVKIVIDNNFIFGQIKSIVTGKRKLEESFIYRILKFPYIKLYAPHFLKEELFDIIYRVIQDKKIEAGKLAHQFLKDIELLDAYWVEDWKQAQSLIGDKDPKDVPYLALAINIKGHGILSNDKHFTNLSNIKTFNISETENIVTNFNEGLLSFCILGGTLEILKLLFQIMSFIFIAIFDIISEIAQVVLKSFKELDLYYQRFQDTSGLF